MKNRSHLPCTADAEAKYLYIVFSSTPYRIGRMIRKLTGEVYNHVSIALDESLDRMYGFARRYYHTPLYGGFVRESVSRYHVNGQSAQIKLCRIPITPEQYQTLEALLADMLQRQEQYLYNHFSAIAALFHRPIPVKNAYICVEFVVHILHSLGIQVEPGKYYSVGTLEAMLDDYTVYTGPIPDTQVYETVYFARKPIPHPVLTTVLAFLELFERL